ncbi:MAG: hypothetical protein ACLQVL_20485 [Terriglobia bacterium]
MEIVLLADLRAANQAMTRFVSELSVTNLSPQNESYSGRIESLTAQLRRIERVLRSIPPPGSRNEELAKELRTYVVNLGLIKKAIEELGPVLEEKMRLTKETIARMDAARNWSDSMKDLSK